MPHPPQHPKKYLVKTLGCKANYSDSLQIESQLRASGMQGDENAPDWIVVNSCTVTDEADRASRRLSRQMKRKHPGAKVIFTGCGAEVFPSDRKGMDAIVPNREKFDFVKGVGLGDARPYGELRSIHPMDREWAAPELTFRDPEYGVGTARTRYFLKIQEGCNSFCTFCIIPYGRGPSRSLPAERVIVQIDGLVEQGCREVILTGTNIGDYPDFARLLERILDETSIERLRISSLDPSEISSEIIDRVAASERLCSHFHVSLQNVDSGILRLMKRQYRYDEVERCLNEIQKKLPNAFVGMDYIVGFPGETDEIYEKNLEKLTELPWSRLHVFPYSEREGTPATKLSGVVPVSVRKARVRRLIELSTERLKTHYHRRQGNLKEVLIESSALGPDGSRDWLSGYTRNYERVVFQNSSEFNSNELISVRPRGVVVTPDVGEVYFLASVC